MPHVCSFDSLFSSGLDLAAGHGTGEMHGPGAPQRVTNFGSLEARVTSTPAKMRIKVDQHTRAAWPPLLGPFQRLV